jgi:DNA-binding transcriptional LysR family regulator
LADLRDLRALVAVAEELSFTRAAERLNLSQQTVSETVRGLERELGVELLERTTREVRVTDAGKALLAEGREALSLAYAAFEAARAVGTGHAGTLRVGVTPAIGPEDRHDLVRALRPDHPELSISLRELRPGEFRRALGAHEVDLVLNRATGGDAEDIHSAALRPTPMKVYVRADHRLASRGRATLAEFDGERLLTPSAPGTPYTDLLLRRFAEAGATVTPVETKVSGGSVQLTELDHSDAIAAMPLATPTPPGIVLLDVDNFTLPLQILWAAGRPPVWVDRIRDVMSPPASEGHSAKPSSE